MQQIANLWITLDNRKRLVVVLATGAMFAAVLALARMASAPSISLLYAGLESGPAGEVVSALEQRGVAYDVRGGAIFVDTARRDELRMTLASEGLPANSSKGYELLDGLSGFGTTSQMFNAAYWRAKEGELARTIVSHPAISGARVHIANAGSNPFQRDVKPSASISLNTAAGGVSTRHARALRFLVASAVTGLAPEDVSVIDSNGELVGAADDAPANTTEDRAEALRQRVQRMLEARVGHGNAIVEVSVETVTRTESVRERVIDPDSRVAISTETEERSDSASDQGGGDVTVASNLPDGDAAGGDSSSRQGNETRERVNYEVSETERQVTHVPGAIKRLSVAVLVNGTMTDDGSGNQVFQPRSQEELGALHELVASTVGFNEDRGDVITLKTMQLEPGVPLGTAAEASFLGNLAFDVMSIVQALVLAIVAIVLGLFVVRPVLSRTDPAPASLPAPPTPSSAPGVVQRGSDSPVQALTGEIDNGEVDTSSMAVISSPDTAGSASASSLSVRHVENGDPVERLRNLIGERQDETVEILRSWLEGEEEKV